MGGGGGMPDRQRSGRAGRGPGNPSAVPCGSQRIRSRRLGSGLADSDPVSQTRIRSRRLAREFGLADSHRRTAAAG